MDTIQVIALRPFKDAQGNEKKKHKLFTHAGSVNKIFEDPQLYLNEIPKEEHWNLYYTALHCKDPKKYGGSLRRFASQKVIPFDIDGIDVAKYQAYIPIVAKVLNIKSGKTGIVFTGNGLQFLIEIPIAFTSAAYYNKMRVHYRAICEKINSAFKKAGIPGNADPAVWSAARLLRFPNTENRKPAPKGVTQAELIQGHIEPQEFSLEAISEIPELDSEDHIEGWDTQVKQPKLDTEAIFDECEFMKWVQQTPEEVREPHFYSAVSISARMENGRDISHRLSEAIRESGSDSSIAGYGHSEIDQKIDQALDASGPRTCKNIQSTWGKCGSCKHYKAITSPVLIKGPEFIATQENGFYTTDGKKRYPAYEDLAKYFNLLHPFKTIDQNGLIYIYKDKYYQPYTRQQILGFAQEHFDPKPKHQVRVEFEKFISASNQVSMDFFSTKLNGLLNCKNGVVNLKTKELLPHNSEYGFRYCLPFDFDPEAKSARFNSFLNEITGNDKGLRAILEEFGGYALSGDEYWLHKFLLMTGPGSNGKSVFMNVLKAVAGKENYSAIMLNEMTRENNRQLMEGKLFNITEEVGKHEFYAIQALKMMTSGGEMTVKMMYNQPYKIFNRTKLIFATNELPNNNDDTHGFLRRAIIVPFDQIFDDKNDDKFLIDKLKLELAGILNIFLSGYSRLIKNKKFTQAGVSTSELAEYSTTNNMVRYWMEETGVVKVNELNGRTTFVTVEDLHMSFMDWAYGKGKALEITPQVFSKLMLQVLPQGRLRRARRRITQGQKVGFYDIVLTRNVQDDTL